MKAITICQPYAHLIVTPQAELPKGHHQKLVENRTWDTRYRGPLLIHAGKNRGWLEHYNVYELGELKFGAILGVAMLTEVVPIGVDADGIRRVPAQLDKLLPWVKEHCHAVGPFGFCLAGSSGKPQIWRFQQPIEYSGSQGFFEVADELVEPSLKACGFLDQYTRRIEATPPPAKRRHAGPRF